MERIYVTVLAVFLLAAAASPGSCGFEADTFKASGGPLVVTFIGHGSLMFEYAGMVIHVDPFGRLADYGTLPKADLVLLTHEHRDHLDTDALDEIVTDRTALVLTKTCANRDLGGTIMQNGDTASVGGLPIEAVPAYNIVHKRKSGEPFHPKGVGNGYVVTFGNLRVYIAGDTENIPEMVALEKIDIAFLPMNLPYTMTPEMVAEASRAFRPGILYPYHYGDTDPEKLVRLLAGEKDIEVRIR